MALASLAALMALSLVICRDRYEGLRAQPAPFPGLTLTGPNGLLRRAGLAFQSERLSESERDVRAVLEFEPSNQPALRLMGEIHRRRGNEAGAARWFLLAAQLGWRDPVTQLYWYERELALGAHEASSQRIEALLRLGWDKDYSLRRLTELEALPAGRAALAERIATVPTWPIGHLGDAQGLNNTQLTNRIALFDLLASRGAAVDLSVIGQFAKSLLDSGQPAQAWRTWMAFAAAPGKSSELVFDGDFETRGRAAAASSNRSPFIWQFERAPGFSISSEAAPDSLRGTAVRIRAETSASALVIRQRIVLPPGAYGLAWRQLGTGLDIQPRIRCNGGSTLALQPSTDLTDRSYTFRIPSGGECLVQSLVFRARTATLGTREVWVDEVQLRRASPNRRDNTPQPL